MKNIKKILIKIIINFIFLLTLSFSISCKEKTSTSNESTKSKIASNLVIKKDTTINVFYFHTTFRCDSCNKLESLTKGSLEKNFNDLLKNKKITFKLVNIDESKNKHFIKDYQLFTKSVVLSKNINGKEKKWNRLDKTWNYLHKPETFEQYIVDEIISIVKE